MKSILELEEIQLDALREVANIGAGHAATAFTQLTGKKTMLAVPLLRITPLNEVPDFLGSADMIVAGVLMHILGDITGRMLLLFPRESALYLSDILLNRTLGQTKVISEMERSGISETGNILACSYLNALSDFLGLLLLPSVPSTVLDMAGAILSTAYINFGDEKDQVICIETSLRFVQEPTSLRGYFLLIPDEEALEIILKAINLA